MDIILASASPRRADLLRRVGLSFRLSPAEIDETPLQDEDGVDYVCRMAKTKAQVVGQQLPQGLVIAADTIALCDKRILGKAEDEAGAFEILRYLRGREHQVYTALSMCYAGKYYHKLSMTTVIMNAYDDSLLQAYIANGEWRGKAGACALQGRGGLLVKEIKGDVYTVVGLSLSALYDGFTAFGLQNYFLTGFASADTMAEAS